MRRLALFLIGFGIGLVGCHGSSVPVDPPARFKVVQRGPYAYQRVNDGEYIVEAVNAKALAAALDEIGCGKGYVCLVDRMGDLFDVQQKKK